DLVPAGDHHAALVALLDLADVVLEPPEASDLALVDLDRVADDPEVRLARDLALGDHAAGDRAHLGDGERVADRQLAHRDLALDRGEQAGHRRLHVVERVVDDVVEPDLDALLLGELAALAGGADVEADDDRAAGLGEVDVALGDAADRGRDDVDPDLLG